MLRILILLLVLLAVALTTWQDRYRSTRWHDPLYVAIYPIGADDSPVTRAYLAALDVERFKPIDRFFGREAERYHEHERTGQNSAQSRIARSPAAARGGRWIVGDGLVEPAAAILGVASQRPCA
jgi:hypothetical protein